MSRPYEDDEMVAMARRVIAALGRRGRANIDTLPLIAELHTAVDDALADAVAGLRPRYSLAEIGLRLGTTRQAVHSRWGGRPT